MEINAMKIVIIIIVGFVILFVLFKLLKAFIKVGIIVLIIVLAGAYFTNPADSTHRKSLKETIKELRLKKIRDKSVKVDDYFLFSLTKANVNGEEKIVGIGAFGKVWYFDNLLKPGSNKD